MTNLKLSSKMHLMVIISALIVAIGLAVGLICQFVSNGYFNYGGDYASYNSVVVDCVYIDKLDEDGIKDLCDNVFKTEGVSYYTSSYGVTTEGGEMTFKFAQSVSAEKLQKAADTIDAQLNGENYSNLGSAYFHTAQTVLGGKDAYVYGAIALAAAIAFQFLYFAVRYRLTAAFGALLADVHNFAILVSLAAITRVPVGSTIVAFGALTVLMTMIGCAYLFDRVRKNVKNEELSKLDVNGLVDLSANESFMNTVATMVFVGIAAVVLFVLLSISAMSVMQIITPAVLAILSAAASLYGTAFFVPSVYPHFKRIGDNFRASRKAAKKS